MKRIATSIRNRLSLRAPQQESLRRLSELTDGLSLQKNADLAIELEKVRERSTHLHRFRAEVSFSLLCPCNGCRENPFDGRFHCLSLSCQRHPEFLRSCPQSYRLQQTYRRFLEPAQPEIRFSRHRRVRSQEAPHHHGRQLRGDPARGSL